MAKFAKPIKVVLTPEEWGTVLSVLKGSRPHWNSIAKWGTQDTCRQNLWIDDLADATDQIERRGSRNPYFEALFLNLAAIVAIGLTVRYERRFLVAPQIADPAISEERRIGLQKVEAILLSAEQKLQAIAGVEGIGFIELGQ